MDARARAEGCQAGRDRERGTICEGKRYRMETGEEKEEEQTQQTRHRRAVRSGAGRDFSAINKRAREGGRGAHARKLRVLCWWVGADDSKFSKSLLDEATVRARRVGSISAEEEEGVLPAVSLSQNSLRSAGCAALRSRRRVGPKATVKTVSVGPGLPSLPSPPSSLSTLSGAPDRPRPPVRPASFPFFAYHLRSFFAGAH